MNYLRLLILSMAIMPVSSALAHEGHGSSNNTYLHYLTEPLHLLGIVALIVGVAAILTMLLQLRRRQN
jgi:hypothetical protein